VFVHADVAGGERVWTGYWERSEGSFVAEATAAEATVAEGASTAGAGAEGASAGGAAADRADQRTGILEEAPTWPAAGDAVAWGLARTPRVVVIEPDGAAWWAGEGDPPAGLSGRWTDTGGSDASDAGARRWAGPG
jgi:cytidine deaminase